MERTGGKFDARPRARRLAPAIHKGGADVIRGLIGLLIVVAIVLVLLKVAVAGGIIGALAIVLLILLLLGRL
jgi:hypothetical protein